MGTFSGDHILDSIPHGGIIGALSVETNILMMYYDFFPFSMFGLGFLFMILFWGLVIYGVATLFRRGGGSQEDHSRALELLKERYVKGEITKTEFDSIKKDIQ